MSDSECNGLSQKLMMANLIVFLILGSGVKSQTPQENHPAIQKIDSLVNQAIEMNLFSGDLLVSDHGNIIYNKAFGQSNFEKTLPNTLSTQFQVGSITKDFTKAMVLQLIEQKKLSFNDRLGKLLPGFSGQLDGVTVRQLLMHRSGLGSYQQTTSFGENMDAVNKIKSIEDILPYIQKEPLQFKPGTDAVYSNSGYVILAAIIEAVTGKKYQEVLKEQILDKLNMTHTGFNAYVGPTSGQAIGYLSNAVGPLKNNIDMHIVGYGDGGIYTTTSDLLAFIKSMLFDNQLLSNESKKISFTNPFRPDPYKTWDDFQRSGRIGLAGGAPGISAFWSANMASQTIIVAFSNFDERTAEELGMRVSAILNNRPIPPLHYPSAKYLYNLINAKGGTYFEDNYETEMKKSGMEADDDMIFLNVGEGLLRENKTENAISLYKVYTKVFPNIIVAWNDLGDAYLQKNDKDDARKCFEQALILRPGGPRAKKALENLDK